MALGDLIVFIIIMTIVCGIISFITWIACYLRAKCLKKSRIDLEKEQVVQPVPAWSNNLVAHPALANYGFGRMSDGLSQHDMCYVTRNRQSSTFTDGAQWTVPLPPGKHVFEVLWPQSHRSPQCTIGVGSERTPLKISGQKPLVGNDSKSWGLAVSRRTLFHDKRMFGSCPMGGLQMPDRFRLYINMDMGSMGFGVDRTYWGDAFTDLPKNGTPALYLMVGLDRFQAAVTVTYVGSEHPVGLPAVAPPYGFLPPVPNTAEGPSYQPPAYEEVDPRGLPTPIKVKGTPTRGGSSMVTPTPPPTASSTQQATPIPPPTASSTQQATPIPPTTASSNLQATPTYPPSTPSTVPTGIDIHPDSAAHPERSALYPESEVPPPPSQGTPRSGD